MMTRPSFAVAVPLLSLAFCSATKNSDSVVWLQYEPSVVELQGKFITEMRYGAPNYGENPETDKKLNVPMLVLRQPVNVRGDETSEVNNGAVEGVSRIQLTFVHGKDYGHLVGHYVVVTGTLFHKFGGAQFTDVLMEVKTIIVNEHE